MSRIPTIQNLNRLSYYFLAERARFVEVYPHIASARLILHIGKLHPNSKLRDLAFAIVDDLTVHVSSLLLNRSDENIIGILRHELGHLCDLEPYIPNSGQEQLADNITEYVSGAKIYYDSDDVQTIAPGKYPRPLYLHR